VYDVFLSHSSKDKEEYVYALRDQLKALECDVWLDEDNILTGESILDEVKRGVMDSLCVVLILTQNFFESNWTSLELGLSHAHNSGTHTIPVIVDVAEATIATKYPFLLNQKYLRLDKNNTHSCAKSIASVVSVLRNRRKMIDPLNYKTKVRELNNLDSPSTNKISILITEYEQICTINMDAGVLHAAQIAIAVIDDLYMRAKKTSDSSDMSYHSKLDTLLHGGSGMNRNVYEHLNSLISITSSSVAKFAKEENKKTMIDLSLASILDWFLSYISAILPKNKSNERVETVWHSDFTYQDFVDMHEIDKLVLRSDLIAPPEVSYRWHQYNNFSHIAVRSSKTKKIVGYFTLFPVTDELYEEIKSGNFKDNELDTKGIRRYEFPDFYKLYVACVCVHPDYQNTTAFHTLYNSLIKMMYDLATDREVYITEIITEASTPNGLKLCKVFGLKKLLDTNLDTEIYGATLLPPSLRLVSNFGNKLIRFYQDKYTELRDLF